MRLPHSAIFAVSMVLYVSGARAQTPIQVGEAVTGKLLLTDPAFANGSHYRTFAFVGSKGDKVAISLTSDDFDPNVILTDAFGNRITADDDSGGQCNAWLATDLPDDGSFQIFVNSTYPFELGGFELTITPGGSRPAAAGDPCSGLGAPTGELAVGDSRTDTLSAEDGLWPADSTYFDSWVLAVAPNETFTIDLRSDDFDPYLYLMTAGAEDVIVRNDDGAGGCDARIVYTAPSDRPLRIIANSARLATGAYTLQVKAGSALVEQRAKCGASVVAPNTTTDDPSELDVGGRFLEVGREYGGALTEADPRWTQDDSRVQAWAIEGAAGESVTIDLISDEFDAYLMVLGPSVSEFDDDGAGGCNARVTFRFAENTAYRIIVNHNGEPSTGAFQIRAATKPTPPTPGECGAATVVDTSADDFPPSAGRLALNQDYDGELTTNDYLNDDDTYMQVWEIIGREGETVTVDLRSKEIDSYLFLFGPGLEEPLTDDDSAGGCDARVTITFPQSGLYRAIVNTIGAGTTGRFTLRMSRQAGQRDPRSCDEVHPG